MEGIRPFAYTFHYTCFCLFCLGAIFLCGGSHRLALLYSDQFLIIFVNKHNVRMRSRFCSCCSPHTPSRSVTVLTVFHDMYVNHVIPQEIKHLRTFIKTTQSMPLYYKFLSTVTICINCSVLSVSLEAKGSNCILI